MHTTSTPTTNVPNSSAVSVARISVSMIVALLMLGAFATTVSAEIDDLVDCIPSEFVVCPTVDPGPGDPPPHVGPGDITDCGIDPIDGTDKCDTPDPGPGPGSGHQGPGDLKICETDPITGLDNCSSPPTFDNCRQAPVNPAFDTADSTRASVYRLYCAYFLRYPDMVGYDFWHDTFADGIMNLEQISNFFAGSDEFEANYGELTNAEFVELIYANVLERPAEPVGFAFWLAELDSGARTRGSVMLFFSQSDEFKMNTGTS